LQLVTVLMFRFKQVVISAGEGAKGRTRRLLLSSIKKQVKIEACQLDGNNLMNFNKKSLALHKAKKGKLEIIDPEKSEIGKQLKSC